MPDGRRFLSLDLPRFAMERHLRRTGAVEDALLVLAVPGPHGPVVHAATRAAEGAGARPGQRVVDARGVCPGLRVEEADPRGDADALERLVLWARRWCPWTATEEVGVPGFVMDVTGSTHLWDGEAALLDEVEGRLAGMGLTARLAIAPIRGAAWALARFAGPRAPCASSEVRTMTDGLPVRALRLPPETALTLRRLGLATVGDLLAVPRLSLARRFAQAEPGEPPSASTSSWAAFPSRSTAPTTRRGSWPAPSSPSPCRTPRRCCPSSQGSSAPCWTHDRQGRGAWSCRCSAAMAWSPPSRPPPRRRRATPCTSSDCSMGGLTGSTRASASTS